MESLVYAGDIIIHLEKIFNKIYPKVHQKQLNKSVGFGVFITYDYHTCVIKTGWFSMEIDVFWGFRAPNGEWLPRTQMVIYYQAKQRNICDTPSGISDNENAISDFIEKLIKLEFEYRNKIKESKSKKYVNITTL